MNDCDTGILMRNDYLSKRAAVLLYFLFDKTANFVDYSGGYGVATRMMRDIGFDYYWSDPMTQNLFSVGFEYRKDMKIEAVTAFECFEHFVDPNVDLEKILKISKNIIFSTELLPTAVPDQNMWWYYGFEHGQHVSFYSNKTFEYLAKKYKLNYYNLNGLGLLAERKFNPLILWFINRFAKWLFYVVKLNMVSRTVSDMEKIKND
ncbi:MAG: class I SAM-dependent methyltransferase [Microgenomates group bacterium]